MSEHTREASMLKSRVTDAIYQYLYTPAMTQLSKQLDILIIKNTISCGYSHKSFMYNNEFYSCDTNSPPRKINRLAPKLYPEMLKYLQDVSQLSKEELPIVMGYVNQILNSSNDPDDYTYLLPDALHNLIYKLIPKYLGKTEGLLSTTTIALRNKNQVALDMIKQRMVLNLII